MYIMKTVYIGVFGVICIIILMYATYNPIRIAFSNRWSESDKSIGMSLVEHVHNVSNNKAYIMFGTLLGYERHKSIIPWDDDIDMCMRKSDFEIIKNKLDTKDIALHMSSDTHYKVYYKDIKSDTAYKWSWPFVDIFLSIPVGVGHLTIPASNKLSGYKKYDVKDIYPLKPVFFEGKSVNIPNNSKSILEQNYKSDFMTECYSGYWDHRSEKDVKAYSIKCDYIT